MPTYLHFNLDSPIVSFLSLYTRILKKFNIYTMSIKINDIYIYIVHIQIFTTVPKCPIQLFVVLGTN